MRRVRHATTERAAVNVALGPEDIDFAVREPPHTDADAGGLGTQHGRVADDNRVTSQPVTMGTQEIGQMR